MGFIRLSGMAAVFLMPGESMGGQLYLHGKSIVRNAQNEGRISEHPAN